MNRLAFTIWALVLYDYLLLGAYVPKERSHGMSAAVDARIRALGGQTEYGVRVAKILTEEGRVTGVETASGERIRTRFVLSNASPSLVYGRLIDPPDAVPEGAFKLVNARKTGASAFVVYLGLDCPPEALGIESYGYFIGPDMDTREGLRKLQRLRAAADAGDDLPEQGESRLLAPGHDDPLADRPGRIPTPGRT